MRSVWLVVGACAGSLFGTVLGFGAAIAAMSFAKPHNDGTDGMRELLTCLPSGALFGVVSGTLLVWRLTA